MKLKNKVTITKCGCNQYTDIETPCCETFKCYLNDCQNHLYYSKKYRQYGIIRAETAITCIDYCPWCGTKFPNSLENEWDEILEKEYDIVITEPWNEKQMSKIPKEFKTDEWWKKRGL